MDTKSKVAVVAAVMCLFVGMGAASAEELEQGRMKGMRLNLFDESFESEDYTSWLDVIGEKVNSIFGRAVTEDNFDAFKTVHSAMDDAKESHRLEMETKREERDACRDTVSEAFQTLDYDSFVATLDEAGCEFPNADLVTEDTFTLFSELYTARLEGDNERAREIADEIGLEPKSNPQMNNSPKNRGRRFAKFDAMTELEGQ